MCWTTIWLHRLRSIATQQDYAIQRVMPRGNRMQSASQSAAHKIPTNFRKYGLIKTHVITANFQRSIFLTASNFHAALLQLTMYRTVCKFRFKQISTILCTEKLIIKMNKFA